MNILIIGGNSYIAKNFIKKYQNKYNITTISRSATGFEQNIICKDYFDIAEDILASTDVIINCAAIVHNQKKKVSPDEYMKVNYELPVHIAKQAKKAGVNIFIQLSTMSVYGNDEYIDRSTKENPLTPYGKSKLAADMELQKLSDTSFKVAILRFPMVYGPGAPGNIASLIKLIKTGLPLPLYDTKNQRTFTYIENLLSYLNAVIEKQVEGILLLGDLQSISTSELVQSISSSMNKKTILFKLPKWLCNILTIFVPGIMTKLYGSCVIDSSDSLAKLGDIEIISWKDGISNILKN